MSIFKSVFILGFMTSVFLMGCGESSDDKGSKGGDGGANQKNVNRIDWSSIGSEYNPKIIVHQFSTKDVKQIKTNLFGFNKDVELVFSKKMAKETVGLNIFTVFKESASWGSINSSYSGSILEINNYGSYQCSISTTNRKITSLKGGCYIRLQIVLPVGEKIEVYNVGNLLSKRYFAMTNAEFLNNYFDAFNNDERFLAISNFLNSYKSLKLKPKILAQDLEKVIDGFTFKEEKFKALKLLHKYVTDRENLSKMIENEFNYFDQDEAKKIVGLN
jgi:hypothetical protein